MLSVKKTRRTAHLLTEKVNPRTINIDELSCSEIIDLISGEDREAFEAVSRERDAVSRAAEMVFRSLESGGRVFLVGAGTSGRLGVMEAAECPPTFGTDPQTVQAVMAGGRDAVWESVEGAEDSPTASVKALSGKKLSGEDVVLGIAASSGTPFVVSALEYARAVGCATVLICCSEPENVSADLVIPLLVGPEVIVGSTRLKAATATKMVLNMITTTAMVLLGKTYGNLMVDLKPASSKLVDRAGRIIMDICGVGEEEAASLFREAGGNLKVAVVMKLGDLSREESVKLLKENGGLLKKTLANVSGGTESP
ncbi:MAG: N-acetylmuramic acid 6-phosphate etherase [Candidatus Dadabacteria bacterium]|nr:N-acetylmuramic acid 6-phosphate etherase [Candidatus Dadabacteria bacterium]